MKHYIICIPFLLLSIYGTAQNNLNSYKYVILPQKFDFFKEADKYRLNTKARHLLRKKGFEVYYDTELLPEDLAANNCLALKADLKEHNTFFKTKLQLQFKNCKNETVYVSQMGESRNKDKTKAYPQALQNAFESLKGLQYRYSPDPEILAMTSTNTETKDKQIEALKEELKTLKQEQAKEVTETPKPSVKTETEVVTPKTFEYYAQPIANGYQLVDKTPKVVMKILKTPKADVYIVQGQDAIIYSDKGAWFIATNTGVEMISKAISIKF